MAVETLILFRGRVTEQNLRAAIASYVGSHDEPTPPRSTRRLPSTAALKSGSCILMKSEEPGREFYEVEYGMDAEFMILCRANKNVDDYTEFDRACLGIVGSVISAMPHVDILALRNWETPILEKKRDHVILRELGTGRYEGFISSLPHGFDVDVRPDE
jgi:hypothetical protein